MKLSEVKKEKSVADLGIKYEGGDFDAAGTGLTSLEGSPAVVDGDFRCHINELTSLIGSPQQVGGAFVCGKNMLTSLEGAPHEVGGAFVCGFNRLTSLEGAPQEVGGSFYCDDNNKLTALRNIHKIVKKIDGVFRAHRCPIKSHTLGLLLIKNLKEVYLDNQDVAAIINSHLDGGSMRSALDCQHALIKAGYPEFAKL